MKQEIFKIFDINNRNSWVQILQTICNTAVVCFSFWMKLEKRLTEKKQLTTL